MNNKPRVSDADLARYKPDHTSNDYMVVCCIVDDLKDARETIIRLEELLNISSVLRDIKRLLEIMAMERWVLHWPGFCRHSFRS